MRDPQPDIVRINVFSEKDDERHLEASFHVHKPLICHYSPYFKAAFNNPGFIENETQSIDFRYTSKRAFGRFVEWIYTQELRDTYSSEIYEYGVEATDNTNGSDYEYGGCAATIIADMIDLWIFADCVLVSGLKNLAIDALEYYRGWLHGIEVEKVTELSEQVYRLSSKDSKLRQWFISALATSIVFGHVELNHYPEQLRDHIQAYIDASSAADDLSVNDDTLRKRSAMMKFYVEDPEMPLPVVIE